MKMITYDDIIKIHIKLIRQSGGSNGIKDDKLIDSALNRAYASFDGIDLYPNPIDKIAAITHSLICNHAFVDGNKRVGVVAMLLLLKLNQIKISYTQNELIGFGLNTASGYMTNDQIKEWISNHLI